MSADLGFYSVLLVAFALGMDAFSLSIGVGMQGISFFRASQLSLTIGILHVVLPLLGIYLGNFFGAIAGSIASYLGATVLIFLGVKMIIENFKEEEEEIKVDLGWQYIVLPISVSLDSLSIGFSFGTFGVQRLFYITGVFGIVAALMTAGGVYLGLKLGRIIDKTGIIGGLILIVLGLKILFF